MATQTPEPQELGEDLAVEELEAVEAVETPPAAPATLEALIALAKRRTERPPHEYTEPTTGMVFKLRPITGADYDKCVSLARGSDASYRQALANVASVEPKIDSRMWLTIQQLAPSVRIGLINEIARISALAEGALEDATKSA